MNIRKTVKKIAALVAGTTMLGATIMGATALTLADYPAPFVTNGIWDGKIVVGAKAATSDVVGAIDLAASLQAEATTTSTVNVPGAAGTATVIGDSAEFKTGSDVVGFGEEIGDVKKTFTESDLDALKSGVFDTGERSTPDKQSLKFEDTTAKVVYEENDDDEVGDFLKFDSGSMLFEYHMEFTEGAAADIETGGALDDFESEVLTILGAPFTIVQAEQSAGDQMYLKMLGGQVADTLRDGETKTYTIDGKDYEVTAVFISSDDSSAKLSVNGMLTKELEEGDTDVLSADVTIGVQEILTNHREGIVEFYLGANKLELTDSNYDDTDYSTQTVKVGGESIGDAELIIKATNETSDDALKLNYIKYKVLADDDVYIPAGKGLRSFLTEPEAMLTTTWDIVYTGIMKTGESEIKFDAQSDHTYDFEYVSMNGDSFSFPLLTNDEDAPDADTATLDWGDEDDNFIFEEYNSTGNVWHDNATSISDDDYFIVTDDSTNSKDAVTSVLRYVSLSEGDSTVTFKNLAGDNIIVSYTGDTGTSATGNLIVDGETHVFYIGAEDAVTATEDFALSMDLNGDGDITATEQVYAVTEGGAIIDFGDQTFTAGTGDPANAGASEAVTIITDEANFDVAAGDETSTVTITAETSYEVDIGVTDLTDLSTADLVQDPDNDEMERGYTTYGALFELNNPSSDNAASELTVYYPLAMRGAQVFVTAGTIEVKEGTSTAGGGITTTTVNPIAVGLAVLDTDAPTLGSDNMIIVGGPCVNTIAATLMGNPAVCTEGFTPGKAVIKLFADKNALLVAGYSAQDTLGACYVLSDSAKYSLTGTEVEVVVADLNTISVNAVQ